MLNLSSEPDLAVLSLLGRLETLLLAAVALVSGAILCMWYVPALAAIMPSHWSKMTALSAICMLMLTGSLALTAPRRSQVAARIGSAAGLAAFAIGILVLVDYAGGYGVGLAHVLAVDPAASNRGLPSPQTASYIALAGLSTAFVRVSKSGASIWADVAALALVALTLFLLGGYVFQVYQLVGIGRSNLTAPHTVFCMVLLAFVIAERRAIEGQLLAVLVSRGIGGRAARMLLPGIVVLPFLWLVLIAFASRPGYMQETYARAIAAPLMALAAFGMVAWLAQRTNALERELQQQSSTDELTDVLNRRGFYAVASYALLNAGRQGTGVILFFFDLDGLKQINDCHGHEAGSALIRRFAELLVRTFRTTDTVARLGGDEFVVLAVAASVSPEALLHRLSENVMRSNSSDSSLGHVAYSAGYVEVADPVSAKIGDIVARADALMYEQKQQKKNNAAPMEPGGASSLATA